MLKLRLSSTWTSTWYGWMEWKFSLKKWSLWYISSKVVHRNVIVWEILRLKEGLAWNDIKQFTRNSLRFWHWASVHQYCQYLIRSDDEWWRRQCSEWKELWSWTTGDRRDSEWLSHSLPCIAAFQNDYYGVRCVFRFMLKLNILHYLALIVQTIHA